MDKAVIAAMVANPQAENGHLDLAHEIIEGFFSLQLSGNQWRILWVILRQTYGWKKKVERISITFFEKKTGLDRRNIHRALKEMVNRKIIVKNDNSFISSYGLQKDYSRWKLETVVKMTTGKNDNDLLSKMTTRSLSKLTPIKEKKETIQKKAVYPIDLFITKSAFEILQVYPRKAAIGDSMKSIEKILKAYPIELLPCPIPGLKMVVRNYRKHIEAEGIERKYIIQSNNFFGHKERWKEFLQPPQSQEESIWATPGR